MAYKKEIDTLVGEILESYGRGQFGDMQHQYEKPGK